MALFSVSQKNIRKGALALVCAMLVMLFLSACGGDPQLCLKRGYAQVPDEVSDRALARVIAATAADADRPTKLARQMSPQSFYLWPLRT